MIWIDIGLHHLEFQTLTPPVAAFGSFWVKKATHKIDILIADDHVLRREAVKLALETLGDIKVVAIASDGREALMEARKKEPHVAVLYWHLPKLNGLGAAQAIIKSGSCQNIVLFSSVQDDRFLVEAIRAGAKTYLSKETGIIELSQVIRHVFCGRPSIGRRFANVVSNAIQHPEPLETICLTPREKEVLQLIAEGKTNKEIASIIGVSVRTAVHHRENLMQKLDIHTIAELTRYAVRSGIVLP